MAVGGGRGRLGRSGHRRGRRVLFHVVMVSLCLCAVWVGGLFVFAEALPGKAEQSDARTDAIVVLTGGSGRVAEGLDLLAADKGRKLFVSGVYKGVDVKSLIQTSRRAPGVLEDRVGIGTAEDTIANAVETAQWIREQNFHSLRLVTGAYHMPRSLLEFRQALPDVEIVPHPVFPEHVKQNEWWAWPGTAALVASEYNKYLLAWLRHRAITLLAGAGPKRAPPPLPQPQDKVDAQ